MVLIVQLCATVAESVSHSCEPLGVLQNVLLLLVLLPLLVVSGHLRVSAHCGRNASVFIAGHKGVVSLVVLCRPPVRL